MTTISSFSDCTSAAEKLHTYLVQRHWRGNGLFGPDPGIRINYRVGRFVKSYLAFIPWRDDMYYLQCQGYWVLINWELFRRTGESKYRELAITCSENIAGTQLEDGCWRYPNKEWHSRVATVEGIWACLAMMATYQETQENRYLDAILRWNEYLLTEIGFQTIGDELAINYFANQTYRARVPNNSADALRYFSGLAALTGDSQHLEPCAGLIRFLTNVQKPAGEFAYTVPGETNDRIRPHFQCYQYNAFMCLGVMRYWELTGDERARPIVEGILRFLPRGLTETGATHYACGITYRHVTYHSAALAAALVRAGQLGFTDCDEPARRAFDFVLRNQKPSGGFSYSQGDYRCLRDTRSYPRAMTMILYHLLHPYLEVSQSTVPELSA